MSVTDIDHLQIAAPAGCEAAARRFFGDLLGLQEIEKPAPFRTRGGCWFRIGSRQLHIGVEEPFRPATKAHPAFSVSDIDSAFELLEQQGIRCVWDEALVGIRRFYANDPWGTDWSSPSPHHWSKLTHYQTFRHQASCLALFGTDLDAALLGNAGGPA